MLLLPFRGWGLNFIPMHLSIKHPNLFILFLAVLFTATSCVSSKKVVYFNDLTIADSVSLLNAQTVFENSIQKNDQLAIIFGSSNLTDLPVLNSVSGGIGASAIGYTVEADGNINLPLIGKVKAEGLKRVELEATLTELLKDYTKNPIVSVRFSNYSFAVLGEIGKPGKFMMPTEKMNLLEAISMAGDLTVLSKRENILVIREENGHRTTGRLNLLSKDIFKSPYFYIKTNDLIYVEPVNSKFIARSGASQYIPFATLGISLLLLFISLKK